jgi:hypothetical protein
LHPSDYVQVSSIFFTYLQKLYFRQEFNKKDGNSHGGGYYLNKQFVKDLKIGGFVESQFVVVNVRELPFSSPSRSGESFLKLQLGDISGTIKGIIWDRSLVKEPIYMDDVLLVRGEVGEYNGPQLVISNYKKIKKDEVYRAYFQATSPPGHRRNVGYPFTHCDTKCS